MEQNTVADRIRARLEALGKNASAVALEAGLSRSSVLDILKGKAANPRLDTLQKLTGPLECSLEYLTGSSHDTGATPASQSMYALLDTQVMSPRMNLEAGVYREGFPYISGGEDYVSYRDHRRPNSSVSLYRIGDYSLSSLGILQGDIAHVIDPERQEIALRSGMIVVLRRNLANSTVHEFSARLVEISGSTINFSLRPAGKSPPPVSVAIDISPNDEPAWENAYLSTAGEILEVEGVICRITRELPI